MSVKKIMLVIGSILILILSFTGGWYLKKQQVKKSEDAIAIASEDFIIKINSKDFASALVRSSITFKNNYTETTLKESIEKNIGENSIGAFTVYKGLDQSFVIYTVNDKAGNPVGTLSVYLVKDNKNWVVSNFSYSKI